ncbi:hypothetical protein BAVI_15306 [Neobacillus vireti LMG 21834]|uniref:Uncharacterized protein n=2 Tax=Neobacillus TaxID=2675232 RepID=A0AB94ILI5_9BACI|nr:hypothetical protein BAVI_15306 [Neobacillus vireti LMG 21834]KLT17295.1 hypothetical protein AA980_15570 [Neobacillus vireti]
MKINKIMSYLDTLTIEEKKHGYTKILDLFFQLLKQRYLKEVESIAFAIFLHKLPDSLVKDLVGFEDKLFWDEVLDIIPEKAEIIFKWFMVGVVQMNRPEDDSIKIMEELIDNDIAK